MTQKWLDLQIFGETITNTYLREAFFQELYKHFAESKLKKTNAKDR